MTSNTDPTDTPITLEPVLAGINEALGEAQRGLAQLSHILASERPFAATVDRDGQPVGEPEEIPMVDGDRVAYLPGFVRHTDRDGREVRRRNQDTDPKDPANLELRRNEDGGRPSFNGTRVKVKIPTRMLAEVDSMAERLDYSRAGLIRRAVSEFLLDLTPGPATTGVQEYLDMDDTADTSEA